MGDITATIYQYKDPRDGLIHYVGQMTGLLSDRLSCHLHEARINRCGTEKEPWLRSLLADQLTPIIVTLGTAPAREAHYLETQSIERCIADGHPLTNIRRHGSRQRHQLVDGTRVRTSLPVWMVDELEDTSDREQRPLADVIKRIVARAMRAGWATEFEATSLADFRENKMEVHAP